MAHVLAKQNMLLVHASNDLIKGLQKGQREIYLTLQGQPPYNSVDMLKLKKEEYTDLKSRRVSIETLRVFSGNGCLAEWNIAVEGIMSYDPADDKSVTQLNSFIKYRIDRLKPEWGFDKNYPCIAVRIAKEV